MNNNIILQYVDLATSTRQAHYLDIVTYEAKPIYSADNQPVTYEFFDKIQFAEMIVQKCMALCTTSVGNADYNTGRLHCYNNIKEHFGMKQ